MHEVGFGEEAGGDLLGGFEAGEGEGEAFADAVIVDWEDVGAAEAEDEQHLDGPTTDSSYLRQVLDDVFIGHTADAGEGGDGAVEGLGGEVSQGERFVVGEPGRAELLVGAVDEVLRVGMEALAAGIEAAEGMEAFDEAAMDGGGGFAVELLIDDAFDERLEG